MLFGNSHASIKQHNLQPELSISELHSFLKNNHTKSNYWPAIMKCLALALLLCAQLSLLHGACLKFMQESDATECVDPRDGTRHPIGSWWRNSECQDCDCNGCCDAEFIKPTSYEEGCIMEFDKKNCEYKVFKKEDPTYSCKIYEAVGK
ncbi:beta-microseminoprotein A1-like [Conger conger]|uniref:beta-microseminoprotein A1-like n=1 Tax=Conger conger TaxID=82655 RepID=UPI002A5ADB57|nr:beta-microseminoprotein A1-like [Conger conger]